MYPYVVKTKLIPCGVITYFEGEVRKVFKDTLGFFNGTVITPSNLDKPII